MWRNRLPSSQISTIKNQKGNNVSTLRVSSSGWAENKKTCYKDVQIRTCQDSFSNEVCTLDWFLKFTLSLFDFENSSSSLSCKQIQVKSKYLEHVKMVRYHLFSCCSFFQKWIFWKVLIMIFKWNTQFFI